MLTTLFLIADDSYGAPAGPDASYDEYSYDSYDDAAAGAADAYGAPAAAADAYGAPADDSYGAPGRI